MARLRGALADASALQPFTQVGPLVDAIRAGGISATILIVDGSNFEQAETALKRIRTNFPAHPLVAYYDPRGITPRHIFQLAQSGITELVQLDVDDSKHVFGRILESATRVSYAQVLIERVAPEIPPKVRDVFLFALEHAGRSMDVSELAAALGLSRRTLAWRLQQHGMPSPRVLLTWCRLMVAGLLLDERRTLDSVAEQLNFPDGHSLGSMYWRYLGRGVISLREEGVADEVIGGFRRSILRMGTSLPVTLRNG